MPWVKGQSGNPTGPAKGYKWKKTLAMEERRAVFDAEISQVFKEKIKKARAEYVLDQFMGEAPKTVNLNIKGGVVLLPELKDVK